jgi:hypothetical protein
MNQYRCETCGFHTENQYMDFCNGYPMSLDDPTELVNHIRKYGCASHSAFQTGRDMMLDDLGKFIDTHENLVSTGTHGKAILIHDLVDWMASKGWQP